MGELLKTLILIAMVAVLAGCAGRNAQPNLLQRANVLSQNSAGITIEHSQWGKPIAFRMADEHCAGMKKDAVYRGGNMQMGPDMVSSWRCE